MGLTKLGLHLGAEIPALTTAIEAPTPLRLYGFSPALATKLFPSQIPEYTADGPADSAVFVSDYSPSKDMTFDPRIFFKAIGNCSLGRPMIYAERILSTQTLLRDNQALLTGLPDGAICLAGDQLAGKGRGVNTWLSSTGCLQFTLSKMHSRADGALPLIQYLAAMAVCEAVNPGRSNPDLDIRIKWPNDLYARCKGETDYRKAGGILVNSSQDISDPDSFHVLVGIGVNLRDTPWTICLNDVLASHDLPLLTKEHLLARILSAFERLHNQMAALGGAFPTSLYYKHWLHSGQTVFIQDDEGQQMRVRIDGIDGNGYLMVRAEATAGLQTLLYEGKNFSRQSHILLQPDGNSFDLMKGLIKKKN
jgi:biotin--protein ligase